MKILVRGRSSRYWKVANSVRPDVEAELQDMLHETPSLVPLEEIREGASPLVVAVKEFGLPGSGNTDLLAFSAQGDIAIIECKLATNPESKRKVIGQVLEYAAYLWGFEYRALDERVKSKIGRPLAELVKEAAGEEWNEEDFRQTIEHNLQSGSFVLIIAVDELNETLKRIIRFVNECSNSNYSLHALELKRFETNETEILIPRVHGMSVPQRKSGPSGKVWTAEKFLEAVAENNPSRVAAVIQHLYDWSEETADSVQFGRGETGSFTYYVHDREGKDLSIFTVRANGKVELKYALINERLGPDIAQEFHARLQQIPAYKVPAEFERKWPVISISEVFTSPHDIEQFKRTVLWLKEQAMS